MIRALSILFALFCAVGVMAQERTFGGYTLPKECNQAFFVSPDKEGYIAELVSYNDESEQREFFARCTIGYGGTVEPTAKREGDGKSPEGVWALRRGLCYAKDFESAFPMEQYDENDMWVEDAESADYNTLVRDPLPETKGDRLWERRNTQFRYIVAIEYNTDPVVKGAGSAIFIHAWRAEGKPTAGCVVMAEGDVKRLVEWLDPKQNPHIVILGKE
ncbi:MAG: L,D-transpeptidase family protein [Alistipes sp.]|nr:L,D-transpeptidase family protein [Alistipes sp.]